jgi:hypothetical protein
VSITVRFHLFPFRTQQLSSLVPKIVGWKRPVKIGSRRLLLKTPRISGCKALNAGSFLFINTADKWIICKN